MGLLGTLLDKSTNCTITFTVKGALQAVREFIVKRCTEKGYHGICNKEDAWLGDVEVKKARVEKDLIDRYHFAYTRKYGNNNAATLYNFEGMNSLDGNVTITIMCRTEHANSWAKTVKDSITKEFPQV